VRTPFSRDTGLDDATAADPVTPVALDGAPPVLPDGEPAAGPWREVPLEGLLTFLERAGDVPEGRPRVVAVDGRSGSGKSSVAELLLAAVDDGAIVRTDDLAWQQSFFDWVEPLVEGVLRPATEGQAVRYRPAAWVEQRRPGAVEVPAGVRWLIVEGVGAGRRELADHVDAVLWVQSDAVEAERRGIERDVAEGVNGDRAQATRFWHEWQAEELPFLAEQRPWERANAVVAGVGLPAAEDGHVIVAPPPAPGAAASDGPAVPHHEASEITYDEQRYPARPRRLRPAAQLERRRRRVLRRPRSSDGTNPEYVAWLVGQSMLADAEELGRQLSGTPAMWRNPYARPDPRRAVSSASVWFTAYPISLITPPEKSFLAAVGDDRLWDAFQQIGIDGIHTGPVKKAGGITGWEETPSVDGHFDRISTQIDPLFGTEDEFRALCEVADAHGSSVIDDIVPGHTGKGADFRLAEMAHGDYPGIYHMVEIPHEDWHLLPDVPAGRDAVNLDAVTEARLAEAGYIIGALQRVIFYAPGVKETNWSATAPVTGTDGQQRRWVYLHYFKMGQPSINWIDPSFSGMRLVIGDALHSLAELGTSALRLDANGFLGVEKSAEGLPAWSEGHPLSEAANHVIASTVRKVGGFTFQELNLGIEDIRDTGRVGADLSYDFVNRPAYHHALVTGDTEFLRLTLRTSLEVGVDPASLVHGLQNHDELTYELVHWATAHATDTYRFRGEETTGAELAEAVRADLLAGLTGEAADYNQVFTTNGIACTSASVIAASRGHRHLDDVGNDDVEMIRRAHLLLAMFNAWQPGVFALSGWDLVGALTLPVEEVAALVESGDTRWVERGAHDLLDFDPSATVSASGMPRSRALYGPLPQQLRDETSFARRLKALLALRERHSIATATQLDVPEVAHPGMLVLVHRLDEGDPTRPAPLQVTVLNFTDERIEGTVHSDHFTPRMAVVDARDDGEIGWVDNLRSFGVWLSPYSGLFLLLREADEDVEEVRRTSPSRR
jgi:trehalose synthase